ncbi:MAG TPA: hypothetical protein DD435_03895 [Cyanobacteria bacterium UBA8530]|nr:hypothetical protein [Cyanobacteria bacterium UBA8530]
MLDNCPHCGKLFGKTPSRIACRDCARWEDASYERILGFLDQHRAATVTEVSAALDLAEELILLFIQEGRIQTQEHVNLLRRCQNCGEAIASGSLCKLCLVKVKAEFNSPIKTTKAQHLDPLKKTQPSYNAAPTRGPIGHEMLTDKWSKKNNH